MTGRAPAPSAMVAAAAVAVAVAAASLTAACGRGGEPDSRLEPPRAPNVLLVVLDTVRADVLSTYGHGRLTTPSLDRLAADSVRFDRAYSTSFWTLPAHASLLTGLYPRAAGATSETNVLPAERDTVAERLRRAGYRCGGFVRNPWLSRERGFAQGFEPWVEGWTERHPDEATAEIAMVERAARWMREGGAEPFFAVVNLNQAHLPYTPTPEAAERFLTPGTPDGRVRRMASIAGGWGVIGGGVRLGADDLRTLRELYEAEVWMADRTVGRLLDGIASPGIDDDTLVIVTSDHGENLGEHGMIDHLYSLYETTVRVPLLVRPPGSAGGTVDERLVSLVDVAATILAAAGLDPPAGTVDLAVTPAPGRTAVFAANERPVNGVELLRRRFPAFDTDRIDHRMLMIRDDRYKLIWAVGRDAELYDLVADPVELDDLFSRDDPADRELLERLRGWDAEQPSAEVSSRESTVDEAARRRLEALGYLD